MSGDVPPRVIIQLDDAPGSPEAPAPMETPTRRGAAVVLAIVAVLAGTLLWSASTPSEPFVPDVAEDDEEISESSTADVAEAAGDPTAPIPLWAEISDDMVEYAPMGDFLTSATRGDDGWLALRRSASGSRLVSSTDGLKWAEVESEFASTNLFGIDRVDGSWRTMVNSASLNEHRFTLLTQTSVDGMDWELLDGAEQHTAAGNQPSHVDLNFGNSVAVGDRPLDLAEPLEVLVELVGEYVHPDIAAQTCSIALERGAAVQTFNLLSCDGEVLGRIADDDPQRMSTISTVAFLLQFQSVVMVQLDGHPVEEVVLPPGDQIASIAATPSGFVAVVIDTLGDLDAASVRLGKPLGRLVRWSPIGPDGCCLVDVIAELDPPVDLTDWFENSLRVSEDGTAVFATPANVFHAISPYEEWSPVLAPPIEMASLQSHIQLGPEGRGVVFQDQLGQVWFGRVGAGWVRVPQVDNGTARGVLLTTDTHVVGIFEFDAFVFALVRVPVETPAPIDPHSIQSIAPIGDDWMATVRGSDVLYRSTNNGLTWSEDTGDLRLENVVSVGVVNDEPAVLIQRNPANSVETHLSVAGGGVGEGSIVGRLPELWIPSGRVVRSEVGEVTIVVVEDSWDRPVPKVSDVLAEYVDRDMADSTCGLNRTVLAEGKTEYELLDCGGGTLGVIDADLIQIGGSDDDLLAFSQEVLRTRTVVYVAIPDREAQMIELEPTQLILDIAATSDGFVAFILDSSKVLDNVDFLYSQSFAALLIGWEIGDESTSAESSQLPTPIPTPMRASAWSLNQVVVNNDASITIVSPIGLHRADPPFTDWTLLSGGPLEIPGPGRIARAAVYGEGFYMPDPQKPDTIYASVDGVTWEPIKHDGAQLRRMLIATDAFLTFDTVDRTIVRVMR